MGNSHIKDKGYASDKVEVLKNKVRHLQGEINGIMCMRENENKAYEQAMMVFAIKQAEWSKERRRLKGEAKRLRKKLKKIEKRFEGVSNELMVDEKNESELQLLRTSFLLEHIMGRDEAIEKWKRLYFAIKVELDDLIQRTSKEGRLCWKAEEEDTVEKLKKQLEAKEETIELLQARLASLEQKEFKRERERDILRQSLRIMSHKMKAAKVSKSPSSTQDEGSKSF